MSAQLDLFGDGPGLVPGPDPTPRPATELREERASWAPFGLAEAVADLACTARKGLQLCIAPKRPGRNHRHEWADDPDGPAIAAVAEWSARVNGVTSAQHAWCMAAAAAMLAGADLPASGPGTAYTRRTTAQARAETIRTILDREGDERGADPWPDDDDLDDEDDERCPDCGGLLCDGDCGDEGDGLLRPMIDTPDIATYAPTPTPVVPEVLPDEAGLCRAWSWAWGHAIACAHERGHEGDHDLSRHACAHHDHERGSSCHEPAWTPPENRRRDGLWQDAITWDILPTTAPSWPDENTERTHEVPGGDRTWQRAVTPDGNGHGVTVQRRDTRCDEPDPDDPDENVGEYWARGACLCGWRGEPRPDESDAYYDAAHHAWPWWWLRLPVIDRPPHEPNAKQQARHRLILDALPILDGDPDPGARPPVLEHRSGAHCGRAHIAHEHGGRVAVDAREVGAAPYTAEDRAEYARWADRYDDGGEPPAPWTPPEGDTPPEGLTVPDSPAQLAGSLF